MQDANLLTCFTIALFSVTLAFTRPLFFHLFRTGGHLYGSARGGDVARLTILFGAMSLSITVVWLFLVLCSTVPTLRSHMELWITVTIWGCLSLCMPGLFLRAVNPLSIAPSAKDPRPIQSQSQSARRVLVLVFDELDQRLLFDDRYPGLALPTIDAFMARALALNNAIPPCRCTEISIPALLTGRMVFETISIGPQELALQFSVDGSLMPLAAQRTVFHDAFDLGYRVGCNIGYHPLDRIFPGLFAAFAWQEAPDTELGIEGGWVKSIVLQVRSILETPTFSPFSDSLYGRHSVSRYHHSLASAVSILRDDTIDLAFLHLPVPHPPFIFDRRGEEVTSKHARKRSYHDNLALVDRSLAILLDTIRTSSKDRESIVILTSDHWWRHSKEKDVRVPFAVWFSATEPSIKSYAKRRNTVFLKDLVLELLEGKVVSDENIVNWLDAHAMDHAPTKT